VNVETKEQSKQWMHTHSPNKPKKFKQMLSACQKSDGDFLGQERYANGGIHAAREEITSDMYCETLKSCLRPAIQNKRRGMLTYSLFVVRLHDNVLPHIAARTRALLEHFSWELFDHPPYSPDLILSDYHLFTCSYQKNWLGSQCFNNNEELTVIVKTWLSSKVADFCDTST
jgi:hypothetical protein